MSIEPLLAFDEPDAGVGVGGGENDLEVGVEGVGVGVLRDANVPESGSCDVDTEVRPRRFVGGGLARALGGVTTLERDAEVALPTVGRDEELEVGLEARVVVGEDDEAAVGVDLPRTTVEVEPVADDDDLEGCLASWAREDDAWGLL